MQCSGYMPPEYAIHGVFSTKSDVFSFGVLMLEIVSGRRNRGFRHLDSNLSLLGHVSIVPENPRAISRVNLVGSDVLFDDGYLHRHGSCSKKESHFSC